MVLTSLERQFLYEPYLEILRDYRIQNRITQTELAAKVNLSSKYVTLVEGGKRIPTIETMLALLAATGIMRSTAEQLMQELIERFEWQE
jgi:transcriptional regulator with XRE-family HTH domain